MPVSVYNRLPLPSQRERLAQSIVGSYSMGGMKKGFAALSDMDMCECTMLNGGELKLKGDEMHDN